MAQLVCVALPGMLPVLFDKGKGGAAHAPAGLNAENRAAPEQWIRRGRDTAAAAAAAAPPLGVPKLPL